MGKDEFIVENIKLVHHVARRYRVITNENPFMDYEDLVSEGTIGLIKACNRFDESYGVQFSTYAVPLIEGEIRRFIRDQNDILKFPRITKETYNKIRKYNLMSEEPQVIADKLDVPLNVAKDALEYHKYKYTDSLNQVVHDDGTPITLADQIGKEYDLDSSIDLELFLKKLDDRTRRIIEMRLQDMRQKEIGQVMGFSQVHISRILKKVREVFEEERGVKVG